jgi:hypothetical protein
MNEGHWKLLIPRRHSSHCFVVAFCIIFSCAGPAFVLHVLLPLLHQLKSFE